MNFSPSSIRRTSKEILSNFAVQAVLHSALFRKEDSLSDNFRFGIVRKMAILLRKVALKQSARLLGLSTTTKQPKKAPYDNTDYVF